MEQLEKMLKDRDELTVSFNAWRHDKEDSLWAAFALEFMHQVSSSQSFWQRINSRIKLYKKRFSWKDGKIDLIRNLAIWFSFFSVAVTITFIYLYEHSKLIDLFPTGFFAGSASLQTLMSWLTSLGGGAALLGIIISAMIKLKSIAGSPLEFNFNRYFKSPDYENRVAFIESFHKDFKNIVDAYAGDNKIYIFIDDLDRCEVPKASDLMQAINLMISYDPRLIFIIGMDREKVAASIAVKNESLLSYLYSVKPPSGDSAQKPGKTNVNVSCEDGDLKPEYVNGLKFGYEFIEKFIQVPFTVPLPTGIDLVDFLDPAKAPAAIPEVEKGLFKNIPEKIKGYIPFKNLQHQRRGIQENPKDSKPKKDETVSHDEEERIKDEKVIREKVGLLYLKDSKRVQSVILMAASALDNNPRRIKQFVNLFRLRIYIAKKTGLLDHYDDLSGDEGLTLEQLGKIVAINIKWPLLLKDMETDPLFLSKLQEESINPGSQKVKQWGVDEKLMELLRFKHTEKKYNLSSLNVSRLLCVSKPPIFQGKEVDFLGIKFVPILAGEFYMGSPANEKGRWDAEGPVHYVKIQKPFYLGIYPVTQQQWKMFMGKNPSSFKGDNLPVEHVSWEDIQSFIKKLNEKEGSNKYRLPSEAEWEYAARAGTKTRYCFGDDESELPDYAWYSDNSEKRTHPVGQKKPNQWGLYDMHGNVWEWVQDRLHGSYDGALADGSVWEEENGSHRIHRGGSWFRDARYCRSAFRNAPGFRPVTLGFRLLRVL